MWLPYGIYYVLLVVDYFGTGIKAEYKKKRIGSILMIFCLSAAFLNILFYGLKNKQFRLKLIKIFKVNNKIFNEKSSVVDPPVSR